MDEKIQQARETVARLNELLGDTSPYLLDLVDPSTIRLLEKNARYMEHGQFQNLVSNVKRDGALSSLPLCHRQPDGGLLVLSGNHRVQAAVHAGLPWIMVLAIDRPLDRDEQVAIQLSHNALSGKDDPVTLKQLWEEIQDIDLRLYAGLDSETQKEIEKLQFITINDAPPEFKQIALLFLPEETDQLREILQTAEIVFSADETYIASRQHYQAAFSVIAEVKAKFNIVNSPTALLKIFELAAERLAEIPMPEKSAKKENKKKKTQIPTQTAVT